MVLRQRRQPLIKFSTSLSMPKHQTLVHKYCFVFTMPWWPEWARLKTLYCRVAGMVIQLECKTILLTFENSCQKALTYAKSGSDH